MIQDRRLKNIVDIPNASEVFPDVEIKGGVMYYLWDASYEGDCHWVSVRDGVQKSGSQRDLRAAGDVILRSDEACSIFSKVRSMHDGSWMNDEVSASKPFGLRTYVRSNSKKSSNTIKLYQNGGIGYINRDKITKNPDWIDLYKVLIPKAGGDGMKVLPNPVSGKPIVAEKNTACTETYLVAGVFEAKETAQRRAAYMKTKFFRYMLSLRKITQDNTAKVFSFVPVMEPDTDWTDKKLYNHFELTPEEIAHIEATVKEMP
jgi:site-specific DNA-methyltransferase (adenine-specific)